MTWYVNVTLSILQYLAAQDALFSGFSTDATICGMMQNVYTRHEIDPVADCYYFTSQSDVQVHAAFNVPVSAELSECRKMVQTTQTKYDETLDIARRCVKESLGGIFPTTFLPNPITACDNLTQHFGNESHSLGVISDKLARMRTYQKTMPRKGIAAAIARSCNCTDDYAKTHALAGKEITQQLKTTLAAHEDAVKRLVYWYEVQKRPLVR